MEVENINKTYGYIDKDNNLVMAFESKKDVEDFLRERSDIVSCYNPNNDSWTTSGNFRIIVIADLFKMGLPVWKSNL